jgi:1,4-alpha-glucan branching enzyme
MTTKALDPQVVLDIDGYLKPNVSDIVKRHDIFRKWKDTIAEHEGGYDNFTKGYLKFGFNIGPNGEVVYREWAPNAKEAYLIGDFSTFASLPCRTFNSFVLETRPQA